MKRCECGTEMWAKPNNGNVWECQNPDCDHVEPVKKCVKCNRLLHDPALRDDEDERCICCCDLMGHTVAPAGGKEIDWDNVPCCPSCGSFDVRLRANLKVEGWTQFDPETGLMIERPTYEAIDGTEEDLEAGDMGGVCNSCDFDWKPGHGICGGDWDRCRPLYHATIIAAQPVYTHLESRARGPEDAAAIFKTMIKQIQNDELIVGWSEDDGEPYDEELIEITEEETNEVVWTRPGRPQVKDGEIFQLATDDGYITTQGDGTSIILRTYHENEKGVPTITVTTITERMLFAIDQMRRQD